MIIENKIETLFQEGIFCPLVKTERNAVKRTKSNYFGGKE